jgi:3-hydroxybutyryl-CoA dehydrogenase
MTIERVGVLGGGLMGSGIAESVAAAGLTVVVREIHDEAIGAARGRIENSLEHAVDRGKLDAAAREAVLARIDLTTEVDDLADADLVIEAVPEDAALKGDVLADVASRVSADAILA